MHVPLDLALMYLQHFQSQVFPVFNCLMSDFSVLFPGRPGIRTRVRVRVKARALLVGLGLALYITLNHVTVIMVITNDTDLTQ